MRLLRTRGNGALGAAVLLLTTSAVPVFAAAPLAADDAYVAEQNTPLAVPAPGVLGNDGDDDGDPVFVLSLVSAPGNGTVSLNSDGSFTYTPALDFMGSDSFFYEAHDGADVSNVAEVRISVVAPVPEREPEPACALAAEFLSPLKDGSAKHVRSGGTLAVSIAVTCDGAHMPALAPLLDLHVGSLDPATDGDTPTNAQAVSAKGETPGVMTEGDGKYSYKLALPSGLAAGQILTLRARPWGAGERAVFTTLVVRR